MPTGNTQTKNPQTELNRDWERIVKEVQRRDTAMKLCLDTRGPRSAADFELAATDLFVEKAQLKLTHRAGTFYRWAALFLLLTAAMLALGFAFIFYHVYGDLRPTLTNATESARPYLAAEHFVRILALGALILGAAYLFASLGRAFLHEATTLLNRRHAVRLGRLFVYLKLGGAASEEELAGLRADLTVRDVDDAFGWNIQTNTAFRDIRAEVVSRSILGQMTELMERLTDTVSSFGRGQRSGHHHRDSDNP